MRQEPRYPAFRALFRINEREKKEFTIYRNATFTENSFCRFQWKVIYNGYFRLSYCGLYFIYDSEWEIDVDQAELYDLTPQATITTKRRMAL
jgi:hypothetical protein